MQGKAQEGSPWPLVALCESVKLFWELKHKCAFGLTPTLFLGGPSWGGQVYQYLKRAQPS